jgi:hypothetical protein
MGQVGGEPVTFGPARRGGRSIAHPGPGVTEWPRRGPVELPSGVLCLEICAASIVSLSQQANWIM